MNHLSQLVITSLLGLLATIVPIAAQAQQTSGPAEAGVDQSAGTLEEVVVTAQRRTERGVDVPIAITSITGAALTEMGISSSRDLGQAVPGLRIDQDGSFTQPTLRGIGNAIASPGVNPGVATYIDGYYQPSELSNDFDLVGITSIQVLKGPQGTLFGRNATGGAIVVATRDPSFDPQLDGTIGYGSYNQKRVTFYGTGGITDSLAANIAVLYRESDGFVKNIFTGEDAAGLNKYTVRAKLLYKPSDDFSALLTLQWFHDRDDNSVAYNSYKGENNVTNLLTAFGIPKPPGFTVPSARGETASNSPNRFHGDGESATLTLTANLGDFAKLTSYSQFRYEHFVETVDYDATPATVYNASFDSVERTATEEIDMSSVGSGPLSWVGGLYYYWDQSVEAPYDQNGYLVDPLNPNLMVNGFQTYVHARAYALFADGTYEAFRNLFLTIGGRYSIEDQTGYGQSNPLGIPASVPPSFGGGTAPGIPLVGSQSFSAFTPRVVLRYNFAPDANVFASYNKGFKSGGFSPTDFSQAPKVASFAPETVNAYELGIKAVEGRYRVEGSIYYDTYDNQQVAFYSSGVGHIQNAASSEIYGAELEVDANISSRFSVTIGGAYTHGRYLRFANAAESLFDRTEVADVSGRVTARTPELTGNLSGRYNQPLLGGNLALTAGLYLTTKYNFDPTGVYNSGGYGILNTRLTYTFPNKKFNVSVFGNNITDTTYVASVLPFSGLAALQTYGAPATWGIEFGLNF